MYKQYTNMDPKVVQEFFSKHMPQMGKLLEDMWSTDRVELDKFLSECIDSRMLGIWAHEYFYEMWKLSKTADHSYTSPWDVL